MSLLDDVSIVVTPNGYKAGTLFGAIPVPTFGSDEITNGGFATDSDWSKGGGWSIGGGVATANGNANSNISQNIPLTIGNAYSVTYTVVNSSVGSRIGIAPQGTTIQIIRTADGTYTETFTAATSSFYIRSLWNNGSPVSVDNVSVKEWVGADMDVTRATAATRVDENGLVNYAEIIGSDVVTNGDFSGGSTGWTLSGAWSLGTNKVIFGDTTNGDIRTASNIFTASKTYQIKLTVADLTGSNTAFFGIGDGSASNLVGYDNYANGEHTFNAIAPNGSQLRIYSTTSSGSSYSITNISVKEVTRDNVPRIDYTGGGCPHILAEPQRTNLVTNSTNLNGYFTSQVDATLTDDYGISPTGDNNSTRVQWADSTSFAYRAVSISTDTSASIFVKGTSGETVMFGFGGNVTTGDIYTFDGSWQRITFTGSTGTTIFLSSYGGATATDFQAFGLQLEAGSYATSYIPTSGSTVTRNQDIFTRDGIGSLINSTEGVLFVEMAALSNDLTFRYVSLTDGTGSNCIRLYYTTTSNSITYQVRFGGSLEVLSTVSVSDITNFNKIAVKWKLNDFAIWIGGVEVATDTSGLTPTGMNRLGFDSSGGGGALFGKVKQLQVYDTALTDDQIRQITQ